jgi:hypothetical protein
MVKGGNDMNRSFEFCKGKSLLRMLICFAIVLGFLVIVAPVRAADPSPRVEVLPGEGAVGSTVFVRIYDYTPNKQVIIIFGPGTVITTGTIIAAKEITDSGGYAITSFLVDLYAAGRYNVIADDGTNKKMASFRVIPKITLSADNGFVNDIVTVSGTGFAAKKSINITVDDVKVTSVDTDSNGKISEVPFVVPPATKGDHTIKLQDSDGNLVSTVFNIKQKLVISPSSTTVGSEVTLTGTGFPPKDNTIYFDDKDISAIRVDNTGNFAAKFKVPSCADGVHKIKVDDGANRSYCEVTVLSTIAISPSSGNIGMSVGIQGSGFRPGFPITINYDNIKLEAPPVNNQGNFTHTIKVPKSRSGPHNITITDGVNVQKVVFTVEAAAPVAPTLSLPANSARIEKGLHMEWSPVTDPSGVVYVLELARDSKFSEILLSTANLVQNSFDIPEDSKLLPSQKDPYYWRVKAIDGASNEGPWSAISSFHKGITFDTVMLNMPDWAKYVLIGFGVLLVAFLFFWLGRTLSRAGSVEEIEPGTALMESNSDAVLGYDADPNEWTQQ